MSNSKDFLTYLIIMLCALLKKWTGSMSRRPKPCSTFCQTQGNQVAYVTNDHRARATSSYRYDAFTDLFRGLFGGLFPGAFDYWIQIHFILKPISDSPGILNGLLAV